MSILELHNVNKNFGTGLSKVTALKDVNFIANQGNVVLILGPSGSGKSTFLTIAGTLQTPSSGIIKIDNKNINNLSNKQKEKLRLNKLGFILQTYNLVPYLTVKEQFQLVDRIKKDNLNDEQLNNLLAFLGINKLINKYPEELSGGQNQRVAIARALYPNPGIIFADEPTAALDSDRVKEIGKLFYKIAHQNNKLVVIVTHDLRLKQYADQIYNIIDGRINKN